VAFLPTRRFRQARRSEEGSYLRLIDLCFRQARRSDPPSRAIHRCRVNMAHIRQSRPDSGPGFQVKVLCCSLFARKRNLGLFADETFQKGTRERPVVRSNEPRTPAIIPTGYEESEKERLCIPTRKLYTSGTRACAVVPSNEPRPPDSAPQGSGFRVQGSGFGV